MTKGALFSTEITGSHQSKLIRLSPTVLLRILQLFFIANISKFITQAKKKKGRKRRRRKKRE